MLLDWIFPTRDGGAQLSRTQEFLKQIVYGGNDGIVTTFAIVAGFAGAQAEGAAEIGTLAVIVFGLANLYADAVSMGLGEFLSGRSQRDLYLAQRSRELARMADAGDGHAGLERLLRDRGYDGYQSHKTEHERLLDGIREIMDNFEYGLYADYEDALAKHLGEWFELHFSTQDARLHRMMG